MKGIERLCGAVIKQALYDYTLDKTREYEEAGYIRRKAGRAI